MTAALSLFNPDDEDRTQPRSSSSHTVSSIINLYLDNEAHRQSARCLEERKRVLGIFVKEFGSVPVVEIRKADVVVWVNDRPAWKSDWTIKRVYATIARPFAWAAKIDLIARNPFAGLSHPGGEVGRALTDEEHRSMLRSSSAVFRRVLLFLHFTGARPCEMSALEWDFIDLDAGVAVLKKKGNKNWRKTGKPRVIALLPVVVRLLRWIKRQNPTSQHVFLNSRKQPWTKNALGLRIIALRKKVGLPKDAKLYGLRHQFGTNAVLAGVDIKAVAELMGHQDSRTTERNYVHIQGKIGYLQANLSRAFKKE